MKTEQDTLRMEQSLEPLVRPPSLHQSVQDAIQKFILDNELRGGDQLPGEHELARRLGVSRNLIREAVRAMASLGILEIRRGSGLFVKSFSFEPLLDSLSYGLLVDLRELGELLRVRSAIETGMIESAMQVMTDETRQNLTQTLDQMKLRADADEPMVDEDRRFHQLLFENLENQTLLKLLDVFWLTFSKASQYTDITDHDPVRTYRDHADIVDAVLSGSVERAIDALKNHYDGLQERLNRAEQARESGGKNS